MTTKSSFPLLSEEPNPEILANIKLVDRIFYPVESMWTDLAEYAYFKGFRYI